MGGAGRAEDMPAFVAPCAPAVGPVRAAVEYPQAQPQEVKPLASGYSLGRPTGRVAGRPCDRPAGRPPTRRTRGGASPPAVLDPLPPHTPRTARPPVFGRKKESPPMQALVRLSQFVGKT